MLSSSGSSTEEDDGNGSYTSISLICASDVMTSRPTEEWFLDEENEICEYLTQFDYFEDDGLDEVAA